MRSIPLGISSLTLNINNLNCNSNSKKQTLLISSSSSSSCNRVSLSHDSSSPSKLEALLFALETIIEYWSAGICRASQMAELFSAVSPKIVVREARLEDCWKVAETHCSCFFPEYTFPLDLMLRVDRLVAMLYGFSVQHGRRTCLVVVVGGSVDETLFLGSKDLKIGGFEGKFSLGKGSVAGILTVDTVADFLPRKGPIRQRRTGIAYISNVVVWENF